MSEQDNAVTVAKAGAVIHSSDDGMTWTYYGLTKANFPVVFRKLKWLAVSGESGHL